MIRKFKQFGPNGHYYKLIHRIFGVWASNIELYKLALVHRSASVVMGDGRHINNERLEFLGDSVLQLMVSEQLFVMYPDMDEGGLSRYRSKIVCRATLNSLAKRLSIEGEIFSRSNTNPDILGNTFEALCGALYLDCGFDRSSSSLISLFNRNINFEELLSSDDDYKSRLFKWAQGCGRRVFFQTDFATSGNNFSGIRGMGRGRDQFSSTVFIDGIAYGYGIGSSKKRAEQSAASSTIVQLGL